MNMDPDVRKRSCKVGVSSICHLPLNGKGDGSPPKSIIRMQSP